MENSLAALRNAVAAGGVVALTGAGMSTDSGIPDYRGPSGTRRRGEPMRFSEFRNSPEGRRRYWARSHIGWRAIAQARPNAAHHALAELQRRGYVDRVITQNVDGLHSAAGSSEVIDLHGRLDTVVCLQCGLRRPRLEMGLRLAAVNSDFGEQTAGIAPDGDAELPDELVAGFRVVDCRRCGGVLKPDVVFFGEHVPRARVEAAKAAVDGARTLLVLGTTLTVMSGYRFVLLARQCGIRVAIVNRGATRGDGDADVRLDAALGEVLPDLCRRLPSGQPIVARPAPA